MRNFSKRFIARLNSQRARTRALLDGAFLANAAHIAQLDAFERELLREARYSDPKKLNRSEHQVFSQFGEDGIIAEIFRRIGTKSRVFLEIGVENGLETNTTFLLMQGWRGYWIEGDVDAVRFIEEHFQSLIAAGQLGATHSFVTAENIAETVRSMSVPAELDFLSIDIDRNTYDVWAALSDLKPRVAVIEYNAQIPPELDWRVEYSPTKVWNGTSYMGASLKALEKLAHQNGYALVGCNVAGANAFFVRHDLLGDAFAEPLTSENHHEPPRYFLRRRHGHPPDITD